MKNEMTKNLQSKLFKLDTDALYEVVKQFKKEDKGYIQVGESFNDMVRIQGIPPYIIFNCLLEPSTICASNNTDSALSLNCAASVAPKPTMDIFISCITTLIYAQIHSFRDLYRH